MRVLVLGSTGMLGHDLVAAAPRDVELVHSRLGRIDLTNDRLVQHALDETRPDHVVNAAGYTAVDRAEDEPGLAEAVNGRAVSHLAAACSARDITLVHFSTDYVFSGSSARPYREEDSSEPVGAYGRSKRAGEIGIAESGARALIVRTQWLFGVCGHSFPRTMWERAEARLKTRVVNDQVGRPTFSRDLSTWTWQLVRKGVVGTFHAANSGTATWFDVAQHVFQRAGAAGLLSSCSTADYPTRAVRPAYSVLDTSALEAQLGMPAAPWTDALRRFMDEARFSDHAGGNAGWR